MTCRIIVSAASRSSIRTVSIRSGDRPVATATVGTPAAASSSMMASDSHSGGGSTTPSIPPSIRCRAASTS